MMLILKAIYPKGVNTITVVAITVVSLTLTCTVGYYIGKASTSPVDVAPVKVENTESKKDDMTIREFNSLMEPLR